jgi:WD40 repeat protein
MRAHVSTGVICLLISLLSPSLVNSQSNSLMLPIGHTGRVYSAVYSPVTQADPLGAKFILTASDDKTMMLWTAENGKLVKIYKGNHGSIKYACFSPDGTEIIAGSEDGSIQVWNVASGLVVAQIDDSHDEVRSLAVSPLYGKSGYGKMVIVCGLKEGAVVRKMDDPSYRLTLDTTSKIRSACFSPDGKNFVTVAVDDPEISIWETATAKLVTKRNVAKESAIAAVYSADGQSILTCSIDDAVIVWDAKKGKKLLQLKEAVPEVLSIASSPDGKWIATGSAGGLTRLFDGVTGEKRDEWSSSEDQNSFRGSAYVSFSPNGTWLLTMSGYTAVKTWLTETAELYSDIKNHTSVVLTTGYSPSGNILTSIHDDGSMRTWNATNGKLLSTSTKSSKFTSVSYSPANTSMGSKYFAYSTYDSIAYYQLRSAGAEQQQLVGHHAKINSVDFSPDGNRIVTCSNDGTAIIWKLMPRGNAEILRVLAGHKGFVVGANYSPDGKHIVTCSYDRTAIIWNAETGALEKRLIEHKREVVSAKYSPDSKRIVTTCWDDKVRIWDAKDYHIIASISDANGVITDAGFSPPTTADSLGGKYVLTCGPGNDAIIWDANNGKQIAALKGHTDLVTSANYSPDGRFIVTSSFDNFCTVWNAETKKPLYNFIAVNSKDYLVTDEFGRFDGSIAAMKLMNVACGTEVVGLDQFKDLAWEPGLASKQLGNNNEPITAKKIADINICQVAPEVITLPFENDVYRYKIIPRGGGISNVELYVNEKLVSTVDVSSLQKTIEGYLFSVNASDIRDYFLSGAINKVDIKVNTAKGDFNSRGVAILKRANITGYNGADPNLYIISIGISLYAGDNIKLNFASKDATDFSKALDIAAQNLLNTDNRNHVFTYTLNTEPGNSNWPFKKNIEQVLDSVASKATPSDIVVIFFAGHGVLPEAQKSLYLLTAEATSFDLSNGRDSTTAISTDELITWMKNIKACKQVLILDACNSGQVIKSLQTLVSRGEIPADQQRALQNLQDKSGTFILSASASGQSAYESGIYNQGLLTYSLLSGLKLGDGLRAAKYIDLTKWFNSAATNVEVLAKDIGGRQDPQIFGNATFDVGLVDNKLKDEIVLPTKKKVFGTTLLIGNIDFLDDSLGLSEIIDLELMNRNAAGKQSKIAFAPSSKSQDTYYIKGRYKMVGETIDLSYFIMEDKEKKKNFHLLLPVSDKGKLGEKVADEIEHYFSNNAAQ